jgi:uncharacterized SAM-binding protein YcdF (DUF218 family)
MNLLFILLGCNIQFILEDRIKKAIEFSFMQNNTKIDWFLSGGIKDPNIDTISEADKMKQIIYNNSKYNNTWNFIIDNIATNTAENFINLKSMVDLNKYVDKYVITSNFHHTRSKSFADKIIENNNFKWILSPEELDNSRYWENIHIKNVDLDIKKAFEKFK